MRISILAVLVCLTGCGLDLNEGADGAAGAKGEPGATGPAGESADQVAWFDATGKMVIKGETLRVFDSAGRVWSVASETGETSGITYAVYQYFTTSDCSGVAYGIALLPRNPFRFNGETNGYRVRGDNTQSLSITPLAVKQPPSTTCSTGSFSPIRAVGLTSMPLDSSITPPAPVTNSPPLHLRKYP